MLEHSDLILGLGIMLGQGLTKICHCEELHTRTSSQALELL